MTTQLRRDRDDWDAGKRRVITQRIVVRGTLTLETPASFGNGDSDGVLDMPLLRDELDGSTPLLPGTSVAGALRNYVRLRQHGYRTKETTDSWAVLLFGGSKSDDNGSQSPLIVEDARGNPPATYAAEVRDHVRIDPTTRTAQDKKKFDVELLPAGTTFDLCFELLVSDRDAEGLKQALALALHGFEQGDIRLGARKRRGFGQCRVAGWHIETYDMTSTQDVLRWLATGLDAPQPSAYPTIAAALDVTLPDEDARQRFTIVACFELASPLLIRAEEPLFSKKTDEEQCEETNDEQSKKPETPDQTHLRSLRGDERDTPIVSGTSLAGALRARATRILNTLGTEGTAAAIVARVFGSDMDKQKTGIVASRLVVNESVITNDSGNAWLVQQRVGIDRFTGGAYDTALFSEAPLTAGKVTLTLELQGFACKRSKNGKDCNNTEYKAKYNADVGLLLLLLKDLWTSDLPVGGTSSIGRGRLCGKQATLRDSVSGQQWQLDATSTTFCTDGDASALSRFVQALVDEVQAKEAANAAQS